MIAALVKPVLNEKQVLNFKKRRSKVFFQSTNNLINRRALNVFFYQTMNHKYQLNDSDD
jgi:hypothetical protein